MIIGRKKAAIAAALMVTSLCSTTFAATSMSNDADRVKNTTLGTERANIEASAPESDQNAPDVHFQVKSVKFESDVPIVESGLRNIMKKYMNRDITIKELNKATAELTNFCRQHGYPASAAYTPAQRLTNGELTVKIIPGKIGKLTIENNSRVNNGKIMPILKNLHSGDIITAKKLEGDLYRINDIGGIHAAALMSPGSTVGTSDVTVKIADGKKTSVILYSENYGNATTGRYRFGIVDDIYGITDEGEHLTISGLISNTDDQRNYGFTWEQPYGRNANILGFGASRSNYHVTGVGSLADLGILGVSRNINVYYKIPLMRTTEKSAWVNFGYDYRTLEDQIGAFALKGKRRSQSVHAGINGDAHVGNNYLNSSLTLTGGNIKAVDVSSSMRSGQYRDVFGDFYKGLLDVTDVYNFAKHWDVMFKGEAQLTTKNLDSSEQIVLGGPSGVRAYNDGEGSGDKGYIGTVEFRYHTPLRGLTLSTYYDMGFVNNRKTPLAGQENSQRLKGWGVGITYAEPSNLFLRFDYARKNGTAEQISDAPDSRMWFMLGKVL